MKYKKEENMSSAAVVIGALRVSVRNLYNFYIIYPKYSDSYAW